MKNTHLSECNPDAFFNPWLWNIAGRIRKSGTPLSGASVWVAWLLAELGPTGAYPGAVAIAQELNCHRSTIMRAERALVQAGILALEKCPGGGRRYRLLRPGTPSEKDCEVLQKAGRGIYLNDDLPAISIGECQRGDTSSGPYHLTREQVQIVCINSENMDRFLRFGAAGIQSAGRQDLPPTRTDWLRFCDGDTEFYFDRRLPMSALVGYFWSRVSRWREEHGRELLLPDFPGIQAKIRELLRESNAWQVVLHLHILTKHFDLIRFRLGNAGEALFLSEACLVDPIVVNEVKEISQHGKYWREEIAETALK